MSDSKLYLLTNDDGILAPGILHLRAAVSGGSAKVKSIAPMSEQSGKSHGITLHRPLRVHEIDADRIGVEGTPADAMLIALRTLLETKPDWVFSGINPGGNLGNDTLYSGTVAAVVEAAAHGIKGAAFSLHGEPPYRFDTAESVIRALLPYLDVLALPEGSCLNINIPNIPLEKIRGFRTASLGMRHYDQRIHEREDPRGRSYFWIGGGRAMDYADIPGSDCNLIAEGFVTISVLKVDFFHKEATAALAPIVVDWVPHS